MTALLTAIGEATSWIANSVAERIVVLLVLLVAIAWYLSYTAARLDRLHTRLEGTYAALDGQLVRRAEAVLELANYGVLDGASSLLLASAAGEAIAASDDSSGGREQIESDLTETMQQVFTPDVVDEIQDREDLAPELYERVCASAKRVQLARRFHNDAVTDVRRVRRKVPVRVFRLAGHTDLPRTVEFDDEQPPGA